MLAVRVDTPTINAAKLHSRPGGRPSSKWRQAWLLPRPHPSKPWTGLGTPTWKRDSNRTWSGTRPRCNYGLRWEK